MSRLADLPTPALVLDLDRAEANIADMARRATNWSVDLRPHVKTHKCLELARLQRSAGARGITVSTLDEARAFAEGGWDDITWAFPVILSRIPECAALAERVRLHLLVDSTEAVDALERHGGAFSVLLKVDCGYHRAGVDPEHPSSMALAQRIAESQRLRFEGVLTHSGHAYKCSSLEEIRGVAHEECRVVANFAERLRATGVPVATVSVGSTPACRTADSVSGATEIRPGNYVFFDGMQVDFGVCSAREVAVSVLATVVSSRRDLRQCVVDAGALALSRDAGSSVSRPPSLGLVYEDYDAGTVHSEHRLTALSQEHGILSGALPVGRRVRLLPNHSCLTAACFDEYIVARGDRVIDRWPIHRLRT